MADVVGEVKQAPSVLFAFVKKHWAIMLIVVAAVGLFAMAKRDTIIGWFTSTGSATRGNRLPAFMRKWLGLAGLVFAFGAATLVSGHVLAATCCSLPAAPSIHGLWQAIMAGAAMVGSVGLGITVFGAPDVLDCQETHGGVSLTVTDRLSATAQKTLYAKTSTVSTVRQGKKRGQPLVATDLTVEISANVHQLTTGTHSILDDDLNLLLSYLQLESPILGSLTDQKSCTGPILNSLTALLGNCFERGGDEPIAAITVPTGSASDTRVVKYFTRPFALRFLDKPLTTAPWLGLLHDLAINIGLAPDTCLAGVSAGASITGDRVLKASIAYVAVPDWYHPMVAYDRVDNPSSGSNGIVFKNFGGPGPMATEKVDNVHTVGWLSSLKGLGGNLTFDQVTQILAPAFGLDNVQNIDHLIKARLRAQYMGRIGADAFATNGNFSAGAAAATGGMDAAALLFFLLKQPSLDMQVRSMEQLGALDELPAQLNTSTTRMGEDKFYFGALRRIAQSKVADLRRLPLSKLPMVVGQSVDYRTAG